jgi:acyl-CoA dehydrogenase
MDPTTTGSDLFVTEERLALRERVRAFAEAHIAPNIDQWEQEGFIPRDLHRRTASEGLLGIHFDEAIGGSGGDFVDFWTMGEQMILSGHSSGLMMALFTHHVALSPVVAHGTPEQLERFARPTLRGEKIVSLGVTEPTGGSDVASLQTTARRAGDEYVVNGAKKFISSAVRADFVVAAVRTGGPGYQGISLLVIEKGTPGFEVRQNLNKMGWNCSDTGELAFTDVRVPASNLIGPENEGFRLLMELLPRERLGQAGMAYAIAKRSLELAVEHCRARVTFGRPLMARQVVRYRLADMAREVDVAGEYLRNTILRVNRGETPVAQICWAKQFATEVCASVVDAALQLFGGSGYLHDSEINRHYRDGRVMSIAGGTSEMMTEITSKLLGYQP